MKDRKDIHIVGISNISSIGSGYNTLFIPPMDGLSKLGYDIKICALGYSGQEHHHDFSLLPCRDFREVDATLTNLVNNWGVDIVIQAMDVPVQLNSVDRWKDKPFKFFGIFPIESDPVNFSTAAGLTMLDRRFVISKFGVEECKKAGIVADWIEVGIDTKSWRMPTSQERKKLRESLGFSDDTFIVLTVADNQERKNLVRSLEIFADFNKKYPNSKYIMVTREHLGVGWNLRDYAQTLGCNKDLIIFERGLSFIDLWSVYARADCFLLASKAEGLGIPILEAMAVGVPCAATNCTALCELLADGRGHLIDYLDDPDLSYIDPFGNQNRYYAKRSHGVSVLEDVYLNRPDTSKAREFVVNRNWSNAVKQLDDSIMELYEV